MQTVIIIKSTHRSAKPTVIDAFGLRLADIQRLTYLHNKTFVYCPEEFEWMESLPRSKSGLFGKNLGETMIIKVFYDA